MHAHEGSAVEVTDDALQIAAVGGSFHITVTTLNGPFHVHTTQDRDSAEDLGVGFVVGGLRHVHKYTCRGTHCKPI